MLGSAQWNLGSGVLFMGITTNFPFFDKNIVYKNGINRNLNASQSVVLIREKKSASRCIQHSVHSAPPHYTPFLTFCPILEALLVEWQNSTPHLTSTPERRNGNINLNKYFISSSGDRTHNQSVLQSHFVPLRHDWP